jgi:hypothetical protein
MRHKHRAKPSPRAIAQRWAAYGERERQFTDWLRGLGPRFMSGHGVDVHSVICPCNDRHRALVAIDPRGNWIADCPHCLGVTLRLSQLFGEMK